MRYQGKLTHWNDEKGYGFITQNGGGEQVFVHIKSFRNRSRRPVGNESLTYEMAVDSKGRPRAEKVEFVDDPIPVASSHRSEVLSLSLALLFIVSVQVLVLLEKLGYVKSFL